MVKNLGWPDPPRSLSGPLAGVRVVEFTNLAPVPFACMVLADLGADVVRIQRKPGAQSPGEYYSNSPRDVLSRSRNCTLSVDLKTTRGRNRAIALTNVADVLVEGFRPGVMERLSLGPADCLRRNPRLVYGRLTGWGQSGPLSSVAGHDINYISVAGILDAIGRQDSGPIPPVNLLGDFAGGGMLLVIGVLAALIERVSSGLGQVIDAAMLDGAALLTASLQGLRASGMWRDERGTNLFDTGSPFYDVYRTAEGKYLSVGATERQFYSSFVGGLGLNEGELPTRDDRANWSALKTLFADIIGSKTQAEWIEIFDGTDACVSPVLSLAEAPDHPHNRRRGTFVTVDSVVQPAPAPRFGRSRVADLGTRGRPGKR
jgi:alpha-methylacyl-CoA racemase